MFTTLEDYLMKGPQGIILTKGTGNFSSGYVAKR